MRVGTVVLIASLIGACEIDRSPTADEVACERASECVLSTAGCCAGGISVRADAEQAFFERACPESPGAPCDLAICPTAVLPRYAVATCDDGRCGGLGFERGSADATALRGCAVDADCVAHQRCATFGAIDCRAPNSILVVALARDAVDAYEARVGAGCSGTTDDAVECDEGICELVR